MTAATLLTLLLLVAGAYDVAAQGGGAAGARRRQQVVDVGVILDRKTWVGNMSWTCIELALEEFYANPRHANYSTRLKLHLRGPGLNAVSAAAAGVDLLKNVQVRAIVCPQTSAQAKFLGQLGNKSSVPIISFSPDGPSRSGLNPYFIRMAWNDSSQAEAISSIVQKYNYRDVILVYEDDGSNIKLIPDLVDALKQVDTRVSYRRKIHPSAKEDDIMRDISSLRDHWTSVFIVRLSNTLALKFFQLAKDEGMMGPGFVWITAYGLTDIFDVVSSPALDVMQGVLGVKPHVQDTMKLQNFRRRWRKKYQSENPGTSLSEPTVSGLYAYDTIWALALAAEVAGFVNSDFGLSITNSGSTDFDRIYTSKAAKKLRDSLLNVNFSGMSGRFQIEDMQLVSANYTVVNIVGQKGREVGFWTPGSGISSSLNMTDTIIWPGDKDTPPRGWLLPRNKILNIAVPTEGGYGQFARYENVTKGFSVDVFQEVVADLPYNLTFNYTQYEDGRGKNNGTYDELVYKVYLKEFDAVVGDITILANRSLYVDFTLPYTESGVRMLVPVLDRRKKTPWTFLKPFKTGLWLATGASVVFTGLVVWWIEHKTKRELGSPVSQNEDANFHGPLAPLIGKVFYFSFSTLVFAHKEGMTNNYSRAVVIVWFFVVLIVQQSYTASLSSILTVEELQPTVTNLEEVISKGSHVGYPTGSFVRGLLISLKIDESKMVAIDSAEEVHDALSTGKVAVVVDEIPYLKLFLKKYCDNYTMVGPTYKYDGFGYAFPRGSPLTADISRGILKLQSNGRMVELQKDLYGDKSCPDKDDSQTSSSLTLRSFLGLFSISGACSVLALVLHAVRTAGSSSASSPCLWLRWLAILSKLFRKGGSPSNTPDNGEPTVPVGSTSTDDTGSPPEEEGTPGTETEHSDTEQQSLTLMRGHCGRPILSRNGSSLRRRPIESSDELHGEFIAPEGYRLL